MSLSATVSEGFADAYGRYAERVHSLAAGLSDEQFWTKPYPYGNSFGHLVLHLTGNLNEYIGKQIAGTGYMRDREREFTDTARPPKRDVLAAFDRAVEMVLATLETQTAETLVLLPADAEGEHFSNRSRFAVFLHCVSHLNHHIGQMIYLEKELHLQNPQRSAS